MSGTNAHVVLEAPPLSESEPESEPESAPESAPDAGAADPAAHRVVALSARSGSALRALAGRYRDALIAAPDTRLEDVAFTAATGRARFARRLAVVASSTEELAAKLGAFADGGTADGIFSGRAGDPGDRKGAHPRPDPGAGSGPEASARRFVGGGEPPELAGRRIVLPTYPFEGERLWLDGAPAAGGPPVSVRTPDVAGLLGPGIRSPLFDGVLFEAELSGDLPWVAQHRLRGEPVVPAALWIALVAAAVRASGDARGTASAPIELRDVVFDRPLVLPGGTVRRLQIVLGGEVIGGAAGEAIGEDGAGGRPVQVLARELDQPRAPSGDGGAGRWSRHVRARVATFPAGEEVEHPAPVALDALRRDCPEPMPAGRLRSVEASLELGPVFDRIDRIRVGEGAALGRVTPGDRSGERPENPELDPGLLDACLRLVGLAAPDGSPGRIPTRIGRIRVFPRAGEAAGGELWCHAVRPPDEGSGGSEGGALHVVDGAGEVRLAIDGLELGRPERDRPEQGRPEPDRPDQGRPEPTFPAGTAGPRRPALRGALDALPAAERRRRLTRHVRSVVAELLGLGSGAEVPVDADLLDLGFDSMMGVDLEARLEEDLGFSPGLVLAAEQRSVDELCGRLVAGWETGERRAPAVGEPDGAEIESLPETEAEARLLEELDRLDL
jgi:acyl carrier protein